MEATKNSFPRWAIALAIGAPLTVALSYYYFRKFKNVTDKDIGITTSNGSVTKGKKTDNKKNITANSTPLDRANNMKETGNSFFKERKYNEAIRCYTEAIALCPLKEKKELSKMYQNRAAAYDSLSDNVAVIADTTSALELDGFYVKALNRRWKSYEKLGQMVKALKDVTALCIIEKFSNMDSISSADRLLKKIGEEDAKEWMKKREPCTPSKNFISAYFSTFANDPVIQDFNENIGDADALKMNSLNVAKQAFKNKKFEDVIPACNEEIAINLSNGFTQDSISYYQALLLRGTMYILRGETNKALSDLNNIINERPNDTKIIVNALIKRASLHFQNGNTDDCFNDLSLAQSVDENNSDIYHHKGQFHLLIDKTADALTDFEKAVSLNPEFGIPVAQGLYTKYRHCISERNLEGADSAIAELRAVCNKFKNIVEPYTLLAQALTDKCEYDEANNVYQKALALDSKNGTIIVQQALLELQWHNDVEKAVKYLNKAIELDPACQFAYETLASVEVQRGNLLVAVELFDKALKLAKSLREMTHICALKAATVAQLSICDVNA